MITTFENSWNFMDKKGRVIPLRLFATFWDEVSRYIHVMNAAETFCKIECERNDKMPNFNLQTTIIIFSACWNVDMLGFAHLNPYMCYLSCYYYVFYIYMCKFDDLLNAKKCSSFLRSWANGVAHHFRVRSKRTDALETSSTLIFKSSPLFNNVSILGCDVYQFLWSQLHISYFWNN